MSTIISGATVIDGVAEGPTEGRSIWIEGGRIKAIARPEQLEVPPGSRIVDARGKYVIAGLMNANVHLLIDVRLENLVRYMDRFEDLIVEAAQVALKNGLTTVFDTWGPRRFLRKAAERIDRGEMPGSRIFCAGNIVGLDGPYSKDFSGKTLEVASQALVDRINPMWAENVGARLTRMTSDQVAEEVRAYLARGVDFIKFASSEHRTGETSAFLAFSPYAQAAIVREAHGAGLTAQSHASSVEAIRVSIDVGCDLIQHVNMTGPVPIPEATLELLAKRKTGAVVFPFTQRRWEWLMENASEASRRPWQASDTNARNLIRSGATLLLANDGGIYAPEAISDAARGKSWMTPGEDCLIDLGTGHFAWFKAMEEKGCPPLEMLRAATRNIAVAYGKDKDLGTLEPGKVADMIVLDKNPLESSANYRSIHMILKDGAIVDRDALPINPILTRSMEPTAGMEAACVASQDTFPPCPTCLRFEHVP